jgi:hypothetical protein
MNGQRSRGIAAKLSDERFDQAVAISLKHQSKVNFRVHSKSTLVLREYFVRKSETDMLNGSQRCRCSFQMHEEHGVAINQSSCSQTHLIN